MGKTTESRHTLRLSETKMVLDILKNPNFHDQLLADLNNKKHLIHYLCTHEPVKKLQVFLKEQLTNQITLLETYFSEEERKQKVTEEQKIQCDTRLKKLLEIIKLLYKNDDFYNDEDKNLPLFNKLMSVTDDFEVITKLISLLMNTSFQKTQKEFFYHIYFLCDHVDIHDLKDSGIKQVYEIGKKIKQFKFFFIQQNEEKQIIIDDFFKFLWENKLAQSHYRKVTNFILQKYQLSMKKESMSHLALLSKVKLYLKSVKFNNDGTVLNNGDPIVQAVSYANAMYCYIEYFVLGQEITQHCSIPNIFSFPPAYSQIFKQLLEIFFLEGSNKETHLTILKCINQILELQQKTSAIDIVGRLNDNSSLIYKYLNYVKNQLEKNELMGVKEKLNLQGFQMNEFILQLLKIMLTQVQETHELNSIASWIVEKIFKKETPINYNDEVVNEAGKLLVSIEYEQEKLMKIIIQKVETNPEQSKPYLNLLNDLFSKKYSRMVQRRDLTYIARESSESCILVKMEELIKQEVQNKISERGSFLMETIQLISNVCEQSPTLLDSIQKTSSSLIPYLLDLISSGIYVPADINSLTDVINFLHHISLKESPIRNELLERPMTIFIVRFLTMDRFVQTLSRNVKAIGGYIVGSFNRFISNIKSCSKYIFNAFIQAAHLINQEYKKYSLFDEIKNCDLTQQGVSIEERLQIQSSKILNILRCDSKLINLLKIIEKTSSMVLKKFKSRSLHMLLRPLLEINFHRDNVFLDGSLELSLLKGIINQTITAIKNYNQMIERKERRRRNQLSSNMLLDRIEEQENQNQSEEHSQQIQPIQGEQIQPNQRLATQNSEALEQNQENQNIQQPASTQPNQPLQNSEVQDEGIRLFLRQQSQGSNNDSDFQEIEDENKEGEKMQEEKKDSIVSREEAYFTQLTEKMTKEFLESQQTMSEQLIENLYFCFDNLDKLIIPILGNQEAKQTVLKQMTEFSVYEEIERQSIQAFMKNESHQPNFSFNAVNLSITIYSSKLERLIKFMQLALNLDNDNFNHAEFQNVILRFDKYLRFYLQLVAQSNSKNMYDFMKNQEVKYLETSKLPKSRVQNKSIDVQNLKRNLQVQLNQRWTLFNVLYDSFLKLVSGSLNGSSGKAFIILPQFQDYFQMMKQTILENVQNYLLTKVLPILKTSIGVRDFQRYRQSIKVVMEIFGLNELKSTLQKGDSNTLITLYLYNFDPSKENLLSTLSLILAEQEQKNDQQESFMLEDTVQNRWKLIKKVFLKMNYYKIKIFVNKAYSQDPEALENNFNHADHPDYERQLRKSYFIYSRIHELFCIFIEKVISSQKKNGYLRDFLLFSTSQLASFSQRIINHPQTIFVNFIFSENQQKELTESEFYSKINERNSKMLSLILEKLDSTALYYLPMIFKSILTVQKPSNEIILGKYNEKIKQMFYDVSKSINQIHFNLTEKNMSLGFLLPRKSSGFLLPNHRQRIPAQMEEQLDLKRQVLKFNNLVTLVIEFIKIFKSSGFFEQGHPKISINYVKSVVDFGTFLLSNFEVETHFPQQGDQLVISMIRMVEQFNSYRITKEQFIKNKKAQRQKERHAKNKKKFKHLKKRGKQFDKDSVSNSNQIEEFSASQNIPPRKSKRDSKKPQKQAKKFTKSSFKPSKRQKSQISSRHGKQAGKEKKNKSKQQHHGSLQTETSLKGSILNRSMTDFLKICLTASQSKPYLTARTTQLLINFLEKFSKDVVISSESEIQNIKNGKKLEKFKNKFFVYGSQIFGDLLEVKLRNQKLEGFFYLITYLGMKLMTEPHAKVDFQSAIKRYFYEQQLKIQNNLSKNSSKLVSLGEFKNFLQKAKIKEIFDFSYLLSFVEIKQKESDSNEMKAQMVKYIQNSNLFKKENQNIVHCGLCIKKFSGIQFLAKHVILKHPEFKRKVFLIQNEQNFITQVHQFTSKNFKKFTDPTQPRQIYVKLKNPQQIDVISLPSINRKKPVHNQDLNKKVRFFEYHPEGDFAALVCQIINNIIKIILSQIVETLSSSETQEDPFLKPFNLKILLYSLQIFCRQSPTIVPWIARFKCKKILLTELKKHRLSPDSLPYKKIVTYVYGTEDIQLQNFQEVSFLTLLIKLIYPVSQISTFIFELCLDNNVLMKDKNEKSKETKEQSDNEARKCVPFGSIIRQKIICEIQNQLALNKTLDEQYIRKGLNIKQNCLMMKKIGSMGLLTILLSIRQFAKLCIEGNLMKKIQEEYLHTSKIVRQLCINRNGEEMSLGSNVMRNFLINYFMKPMEMLQQLSIQYHITKRQNTIFKRMWMNADRVHIRYLLTSESINDQLFGDQIFFKSDFKSTWFYTNNLEGDEPLDFERHFDQDDSMFDESSDNDSNGNILDQEDSVPPLDQEIEQESERSLSMSGGEMVSDDEVSDEPQEWYGSQDPFDRQSNTFENFILYPEDDYVIDNGQGEQNEQEIPPSDEEDISIQDEDQLDSYDDSQEEGLSEGLQIDLSPDDNILFPIDEDSVSPIQFPFREREQFDSGSSIVPDVGIYRYYIPDEPQRRDHPNHQCHNPNKLEIKLIQTLYEIFMDVVSFEDIKITNKMVKLQNQQAKLMRKVFKIASFRIYQQKVLTSSQTKQKIHNQHILQLQNEYYDQIYRIFTIDSIFFVSEKVDFKHCQRVTYFLQSFPIHYTDMYMSEPEIYFNEFTKALRRRRGMFMNSSMIQRIRRVEESENLFRPGGSRFARQRIPRASTTTNFVHQSDDYNENNNEQSPSQLFQVEEQQPQENQQINLIEFNVENPNGGLINVSTNLAEILQNMGMSERQFFSLPHDAQSDIIQNSLQSQLQNSEGPLNPFLGRIFGNDQPQAPNVSPVSPVFEPLPLRENEQNIEQANQINNRSQDEIQMPEEFDMEEEQNEDEEEHEAMQQENQFSEDSPINSINNINQNEGNEGPNPENDVVLARYREISLKHSQRISKDVIEILNKDHKNDSKFPQISEELLEEIFEMIFVMQNKDFSRFPETFLTLNMINSKSCSKVISSLITLLSLYPSDSQLNEMIEDKKFGKELITSKMQKKDLIPKLSLRTYLYEISKDYENEVYPNMAIKVLHILQTITSHYSISMQMLNTNNNPLKILEKYLVLQTKEEIYLSSFQTLIRLLSSNTIKKSPIMVDQILKIANNVVKYYFEKNIFSIHQQHKQLKEAKKNVPEENPPKVNVQGKEQVSILPVSMEKQETVMKQTHKVIQLSELSIQLLSSLLMSDDLSESKNLSELIMKLSINGKNLILFLKNIEAVLQKLCEKSINFLNKGKKNMEKQGEVQDKNRQAEDSELDDLKKFFCLLEIFSSMIKEFKQFAYRHHIDRYDFIMGKFKGIIESKSLFELCQTIASIISNTGENNDFIKNSAEIFEIFFVIFNINIELTTKVTQEDQNLSEEKESNKIAFLGEINQRQNGQGIKSEHSIMMSSQPLIQNAAFNKLWNEKVCSPNGRILLNSMIKRKLFTSLKRKKQFSSMSFFDIPMIKIILNSPHMLDFENKRALFRAQMKRLKKKFGSDRIIYMSLDRKQVFQQSFNIIMDKKPQDLKNRVKIDFEGEEGEDAGGLTREWYHLLSKEIFNPNYGLFRPSSTGTTYQPSSTSYVNSEHLNYFKFIGRLMGKALFDGFMFDAYFTPAFYKHILKIPITYLDMQEEDFEYFNSLKWILNNSPIEQYMQLDFTYEFDNFGEIKTKELIPNGANVQVTEENKVKYVQLISYAKMATAIQAQLEKLLQGLHQVVPHKYLKIFDPKELQIMISGLPTIDINDLKRHTMLNNYVKTDQIIMWLFELLESFDMSLRTAFLQFVTGTSKVPPEGFKGLMGVNGPQKFTIQKEFDIKKLPRAHTCFNQLDLPNYPTKEMLIEKLTYAITQGKQGFGIV